MTKTYSIRLHPNLEKQLLRVPGKDRQRIVAGIRSLAVEPRPPGCVKLEKNLYRIRQDQYRIIYGIFDQDVVVVICKVARRSEETYKNIQSLLNMALRVIEDE